MKNKAEKSVSKSYHLKRVVFFVYISGLKKITWCSDSEKKTFKDGHCESVGCNTGYNVGFNLKTEFKKLPSI